MSSSRKDHGLSEEQQQALLHEGKETLVIAAAGSGKTRLLIERLFAALNDPSGREVVAITFTERAAEEMRERAEKRALSSSKKVQRELRTRARITTIDGLCLGLLSEYPLFVSPPGRRLLPEGDDRAFVDENLWEVLHSLNGNGALLETRATDLEAISRSLFDKRRLRSHLTESDAIAATNELIQEERQRLTRQARSALESLVHFAPTPADQAALQQCLATFAAAPGDSLEGALARVKGGKWAAPARDLRDKHEKSPEQLRALHRPISPQRQALLHQAWRACDELLLRYDRWKKARDAFDFVDLGLTALRLAEHPVAGPDLAQRIGHLLVDEVQDTNPLQERLLSVWGKEARVFRVGDPRQAIYGFRDAEVESILQKAATLPPEDCFSLTKNHRSVPAVINLANAMLSATRTEGHDQPMVAAREANLGEHGLPCLVLVQTDHPSRTAAHIEALARLIVSRIAAGVAPKDIAVLFRRRHAITGLHEALAARGIASAVRTKRDLSELPATHDALAVLALLEQPDDDARVFAAMRSGIVRASIEETVAVSQARAGTSAWQEMLKAALNPASARARDALRDSLHSGRSRQATLSALLRRIEVPLAGYLPILDVLAQCDELDLDHESLARRVLSAKVEQVSGDAEGVQLLTQHGAKGLEWPCVIIPFVSDTLPDTSKDGVLALPSGALGLATGPGEDDEATAALQIAHRRRERAEELRLFYVAMTRARDELWFFGRATKKMSAFDRDKISMPIQALRLVHDFSPPTSDEPAALGAYCLRLMTV